MLSRRLLICAVRLGILSLPLTKAAADWPQWRGPNRDGKVDRFQGPGDLAHGTQATVGCRRGRRRGDARPGGRQAVCPHPRRRQRGASLPRCDRRARRSGRSKYAARGSTDPRRLRGAQELAGRGRRERWSRSERPASCRASTPKRARSCGARTTSSGGRMFFTSASPLIVDGLAIAQLGGRQQRHRSPPTTWPRANRSGNGPGAPTVVCFADGDDR